MSSLKIIGLLHFLKFLGPSAKNYNPQSLMITLYNITVLELFHTSLSTLDAYLKNKIENTVHPALFVVFISKRIIIIA